MNTFAKLPPDRENSTYHHIAYHFDGRKEHGYSKKQGANEKADKRDLLFGTCERLLPLYFHRSEVFRVEVFLRRAGASPSALKAEVLVATFYADGFELHDTYAKDSVIYGFLNEFYASDLRDAKRALASVGKGKGGTHDFTWDGRKSLEDFKAYCAHLCSFHERGTVEKFFFAIKRKYYDIPPIPNFHQGGQVAGHATATVPQSPPPPPVAPATHQRTKQTNSLASLIPAHLQPPQS